MAKGVNKVILIGNAGRDPEIRYSQDGRAVVSLSLAVSETWKDKGGNQHEKTEWCRVVAFGALAEIIGKWIVKGSQVFIEGSLQTRSWEQDGVKKYSTEVVASNMLMLGGKRQAGDRPDSVEPTGNTETNGDIPF